MQNSTDTLKQVYKALKAAQTKIATLENAQHEGIAIIGMGCHLPGGVHDPQSYWDLLVQGKNAIIDVPITRWNAEQFYDNNPQAAGKMYTTKGGFFNRRHS
jgi:acyl transferase domain-containing protein